MENNPPSVHQGSNANESGFSRIPNIQRSQIQLTAEELRILRDCNRESFYYRCLPFAFAGMGLTFLGFKRGILTGHPKWGPAFKMTAAAFAGWLVGKISYRSSCEDKFLNVRNSAIADAIRKKRGYVLESFDSEGSQFSGDEMSLRDDNYTSYSSGDFYSSSKSLNFDKNVPYTELDDRERPSMDNESDSSSDKPQPVRTYTTYDELRMKNREEYEKQFRQPDVNKSDSFQRRWDQNAEPQRRPSVNYREDTPKNAYGDTWDNPKFT